MGRPVGKRHQDDIRAKIQAGNLINRLEKHINGQIDLTNTQLRAIEILLKKSVPDLTSTDINMTAEVRSVVTDQPMTADEWEKQHAINMGTTAGATESTH